MTHALRLILIPLFLALMLTSPAAGARSLPTDDPEECLRAASRDDVLAGSVASDRPISSVRVSGASMADDALWDLAGGAPSLPISPDEAVALVARLAQTGLFSAVEPKVRALPDGEVAELDVALTENPKIASVRIRGLSEFRTEDILDRLLEAPDRREVERRWRQVHDARPRECPAPLPPRLWLARVDDGEVRAGILWRGLRPGLDRVLRYLRTRGYPLARLEGELTPAGDLLVVVDEGHLGGVSVGGVDPHLVREVEDELGIRRGDVFSSGELYNALERIQRRWPFLRADRRNRRTPPPPALRLEPRPGGGVQFRTDLPFDTARPPPDEEVHGDADDFVDDFLEDLDLDEVQKNPVKRLGRRFRFRKEGAWYAFDGDTLVVHLRSDRSRAAMQWVELLRHTPVTGFAPGLAGTITIYDPADRTHLLLDGAVNVNTRRPSLDATGATYLQRLNAQQRVDWLAGPRLRMPGLDIAELGGQIHTLTDTADRWRISPIDSYVYSALLNRADREYYRRSGFAAFLTLHLFEMLTLGGEYRYDRYASLAAPPGVWSLFNRDDPRYGSAAVDEGEMGSVLFRMEYRSEKVSLHRVGSMWRNSETSLVEFRRNPDTDDARQLGLRSVNTVEVADKSLGGVFKFTRIVSDSSLTLETGRHDTLTLRLRGAGGHDLPLQKMEGLGGWTALRGYDFKEFRGDASLLGTVQVEGRHFGAFLDVGSVRNLGSWMDPRPSVGALFIFANGSTRMEAAWRLDGKARLAPDFRILFGVPL
ncbi:MAG: hypothetical protein ABR567_12675 [Myxococcales bacterium]|nr:hypothetical protein [Myxococcales bacterium]